MHARTAGQWREGPPPAAVTPDWRLIRMDRLADQVRDANRFPEIKVEVFVDASTVPGLAHFGVSGRSDGRVLPAGNLRGGAVRVSRRSALLLSPLPAGSGRVGCRALAALGTGRKQRDAAPGEPDSRRAL